MASTPQHAHSHCAFGARGTSTRRRTPPARLATARGSAPPSPAARTPATCAAMGAGGERQPGIGQAPVPVQVRLRRAPQQGPKPHRIRTLGNQQRCAAISACERSARRAGQLTRTCRWQPIGTLRRVCTNARGLNVREPRPRQSGGGARTVRQSRRAAQMGSTRRNPKVMRAHDWAPVDPACAG